MNTKLRNELINHVIETIENQDLNNFEDLHFNAFNEDYYIIGYCHADMWLKKHDISPWEAIGDVIEWELDTFGEVNITADKINSESIVNLYVYMLGEQLLGDFDLELPRDELLVELLVEMNC